jgi:hypothetical protein
MLDCHSVVSKDLIGKVVRVRVGVEEYMGMPQPKVRSFMPVGDEDSSAPDVTVS